MTDASGSDPILVEVTRGALVESCHRGTVTISRADGEVLLGLGDVERPVFPRSAVKLLQAVPLVESGAAEAFGLGEEELAIACASHSGAPAHVAAVRRLLGKAGVDEALLACGTHWPISEEAARALERHGERPSAVHNNCSGKHAGMLAAAKQLGLPLKGYERADHPLQQTIARILAETCGVELASLSMGIDGCSVPTWALSLHALARGFARIATGEGLPAGRKEATQKLMRACFAAPFMISGSGRFDTVATEGLAPSLFVKGGAEGAHVAALPELGLGVAIKIDDGTKRGTERALAEILALLVPKGRRVLRGWLKGEIRNWRGTLVGELRLTSAVKAALAEMADRHDLASPTPR